MISIIIASVLAFGFGAAWYMGPIGKKWLDAKIWSEQNIEMSQTGKYMAMMYGSSFALTVLVSYVLSVMFTVVDAVTLGEHLRLAMLLCFGFVITTKFSDMLYTGTPPFWGKRAQTVFLVDSGYYIGVFAIIATVLYYL